jgi:hypothetical protein
VDSVKKIVTELERFELSDYITFTAINGKKQTNTMLNAISCYNAQERLLTVGRMTETQ